MSHNIDKLNEIQKDTPKAEMVTSNDLMVNEPEIAKQLSEANIGHAVLISSDNNFGLKLTLSLFYSALFPVIAFSFEPEHLGTIIAFTYLINAIVFWTLVVIGAISAKRLHRVHALLARHEDLGIATFCYGLKEDTTHAVESISELLAIQGTPYSVAYALFASSSAMLCGIGLVRVWTSLKDDINGGFIGCALCYAEVIGFRLINLFELNVRDKRHVIMHYIGFIFMFAGPFSVALVHNWNIWSIIWVSLLVPFVGGWLTIPYFYDSVSTNPKYVRKVSLIYILVELLYALQCTFSIFLYLYAIRDVQPTIDED